MKRFVFLCFLIVSMGLEAFAQEQVSGFIHRFGTDVLISLSNNNSRLYRLSSSHSESQRIIRRLEEGDFVMGTGEVNSTNGIVSLDGVDFVGLRRIIGLWNTVNSKGLVNFRSYSDMNVYSLILQSDGLSQVSARKNFKYTVTPGTNSDWVVFMSDEKETQMGYLKVENQKATLQLMNPKTGDISTTLELQKLAQ